MELIEIILILIVVILTVFVIIGNFVVWFSETDSDETVRYTVGTLTLIVIYIWVVILTFGG